MYSDEVCNHQSDHGYQKSPTPRTRCDLICAIHDGPEGPEDLRGESWMGGWCEEQG